MFGQGDRTITAPRDAAGLQTAGQTASLSRSGIRQAVPSADDAGGMGGSAGISRPRRPA
jgi:hypothetical protein